MGIFLLVFSVVGAMILAIHVALSAGIVANMAAEKSARGQGRLLPGIRAEVIVAVRDEAATLPLLLESLRAQTRRDILFLFVDDRSKDLRRAIADWQLQIIDHLF